MTSTGIIQNAVVINGFGCAYVQPKKRLDKAEIV